MKDLRGKTAFITGAGPAVIGLGMAHAFGQEGMNVVIADIEDEAIGKALDSLRDAQIRADGVRVDVAQRDSLREAALRTISAFGKVHVVCNNAGVTAIAPLGRMPEGDWNWLIDVNLLGRRPWR